MDGSASIRTPAVPDSTQEEPRLALESGTDHEQLGVRSARHHRLHAVEDEARRRLRARGGRAGANGVEERPRLGQRERRRGHVVTGEGRQVGGLLLLGAPQRERRWRPRLEPGRRRPGPCHRGRAPRRRGRRPSRNARWRCRRAPRGPRAAAARPPARQRSTLSGAAVAASASAAAGRSTSSASSRTSSTSICSSSVGVRSKRPRGRRRRARASGGPAACLRGRTGG